VLLVITFAPPQVARRQPRVDAVPSTLRRRIAAPRFTPQ